VYIVTHSSLATVYTSREYVMFYLLTALIVIDLIIN